MAKLPRQQPAAIEIPAAVVDDAAVYASALDAIGGPELAAEIMIEGTESARARRALEALRDDKRDEALWVTGWFRGVADVLGCEALEVLASARTVASVEVAELADVPPPRRKRKA